MPTQLFPSRLYQAGNLGLLACLLLVLSSCHPPDLQLELQEAMAAAVAGQLESALHTSNRCLQAAPDNMDAVALNNYCLFMLNNDKATTDKVLFSMQRAIDQNEKRFDLHYFYGWMLYRQAKYPEAIEILERAYALLPESAARDNRATRGNLLFMMGRCCVHNNLPRGMGYLQAARAYEPFSNWPELYNGLAILSLQQKKWEDAASWLHAGLRLEPNNPSLLRNLAIVYDSYLNRKDIACQYYEQTLAVLDYGDNKTRAAINAKLAQLKPRQQDK